MDKHNLFHIRPLSPDDILAVTQIELASRPSPWSDKQFAAELHNDNSRPIVICENETVVGYVIPWVIAGEIQIQNIVVAKSHRGKGLGQLLLNTAIQTGLEIGCDRVILEVRESNIPAIQLYQRYQFATVGRRAGYYRDGETALLMTAGPFITEADRTTYRDFVSKEAQQLKDRLQFLVE